MVNEDKPLAYVLGTQPFYPLEVELLCRPPVLVPRSETEHWVLHLSQILKSSPPSPSPSRGGGGGETTLFRILDIGTGSGCIALGLSQSLVSTRKVETIAIDQSPLACSLARENVVRCRLESDVSIHQLDVFSNDFVDRVKSLRTQHDDEGQGFDLVVSNPPYITRKEFQHLDKSVKNWEDRSALVGELPLNREGERVEEEEDEDDDGLIFYRRITSILDRLLRVPLREAGGGGPNVAFEVGKGQARRVGELLRRRGYKSEIVSDPWGVERAVFGWKR
jgi:HemK-like putative methylase